MEDCIDLISRPACLGSRQRSVVCATVIQYISCLLRDWLQVILLSCTLAASVWAALDGTVHVSHKNSSGPLQAPPKHSQVHRDWVIHSNPFPTYSWADQKRPRRRQRQCFSYSGVIWNQNKYWIIWIFCAVSLNLCKEGDWGVEFCLSAVKILFQRSWEEGIIFESSSYADPPPSSFTCYRRFG